MLQLGCLNWLYELLNNFERTIFLYLKVVLIVDLFSTFFRKVWKFSGISCSSLQSTKLTFQYDSCLVGVERYVELWLFIKSRCEHENERKSVVTSPANLCWFCISNHSTPRPRVVVPHFTPLNSQLVPKTRCDIDIQRTLFLDNKRLLFIPNPKMTDFFPNVRPQHRGYPHHD